MKNKRKNNFMIKKIREKIVIIFFIQSFRIKYIHTDKEREREREREKERERERERERVREREREREIIENSESNMKKNDIFYENAL